MSSVDPPQATLGREIYCKLRLSISECVGVNSFEQKGEREM